jgi:hypothetical protein
METVILVSTLQKVGMIESAEDDPRPLSIQRLSSFEVVEWQRRCSGRMKVELVA